MSRVMLESVQRNYIHRCIHRLTLSVDFIAVINGLYNYIIYDLHRRCVFEHIFLCVCVRVQDYAKLNWMDLNLVGGWGMSQNIHVDPEKKGRCGNF